MSTSPPGQPAGSGGITLSPKALVAAGLVVAIAIGVGVGVVVAGGGDGGGGEAEDVQLVSASEPGPNPFTPPVAPEAPPANTVAPPQGPFGGTGDNTLCDREGIITFLTANAAQAGEWVRVLGIQVSEIPDYVRDLVPTTLASDTRITNHTFENGRAVPFQAVLQAGTAVLVDVYGKPVVRCRCGNPLLPPREAKAKYTGTRWPGFDPTTIVVIEVTTVQIFPPGGVGTIPTQGTEATTTTDAGGDGDEAVAILQAAFDECVATLESEITPNQLSYSAAPGTAPDVFVVTVTATETGEFGSWSVNVATRDITPADPVAAEAGQICPNLA
jgi:hypothetical protein